MVVLLGCGAAEKIETPVPRPMQPIESWIPSDVEQVTFLRPKALEHSALSDTLRELFPERWREKTTARNGFRYQDVDDLVVSVSQHGHLRTVRGIGASSVLAAHKRRMTSIISESPTRVEGYLGATRHQIAAVDPSTVVIGVERQVIKGDGGKPLLRFRKAFGDLPLQWIKLTPLGIPKDSPVGLLFARQQSLGVGALPHPNNLEIRVIVVGEFPKGANSNVEALIRSLSDSSMGRIFGIDRALETLSVSGDTKEIRINLRLEYAALLRGVQTTFTRELADLMALSGEGEDNRSDANAKSTAPLD